MSIRSWIGGGSGDFTAGKNWTGHHAPIPGDVLVDQAGEITATGIWVQNSFLFDYSGSTPVGLTLVNSGMWYGSYIEANSISGNVDINLTNSSLFGFVYASDGPMIMTVNGGQSINYGTIYAADGPDLPSATIIDHGEFQNSGIMSAGTNGRIEMLYGADPNHAQFFGNTGVIQAVAGGTLGLDDQQLSSGQNIIGNSGLIIATGGHVFVDSKVQQFASGAMIVKNDGSLTVTGEVDGGSIQIESGMLDFGPPTPFGPGPEAANEMHATLDFTGESGHVDFGVALIGFAMNASHSDLFVTVPWKGASVYIADFHLGSAQAYSPDNFSVHGGILDYHSATG